MPGAVRREADSVCGAADFSALVVIAPAGHARGFTGLCGPFGVNVNVVSSKRDQSTGGSPPTARHPGGIVQLDGGMSLTTGKSVQSLQNDTAPNAPILVRNVSGPTG